MNPAEPALFRRKFGAFPLGALHAEWHGSKRLDNLVGWQSAFCGLFWLVTNEEIDVEAEIEPSLMTIYSNSIN